MSLRPVPEEPDGPVIGGLVLAAGAGQRFGGPKQLAELGGSPLLEHAVFSIASVPTLYPVVVVLGAAAPEILARVDLHGAEAVICPNWDEGQAASLRMGVTALGAVEAAVITLGDQPFITPDAIACVIDQRDPARYDAVRACYAGEPGHPVLLERPLLAKIAKLRGDTGARDLLARARVRLCECGGMCSPLDIDTPEELEVLQR